MKLCMLVVCLLAVSTRSLVFADSAALTSNPKTAQKPYAKPAQSQQLGTSQRNRASAGGILGVAAHAPCDPWDDGTTEIGVGANGPNDYGWLNRFGCPNVTAVIASVDVAYGSPSSPLGLPNGTPTEIWVWQDGLSQDGDPSDAILVHTDPVLMANVNTDIFNNYVLSIPMTITGYFFVGTHAYNSIGLVPNVSGYTVPFDTTTHVEPETSWMFREDGVGAVVNAANLASNTVPPHSADSTGIFGQCPIRVNCSSYTSSDDCGTPDVAVYGLNSYDNSCATTGTQGQSESLCGAGGGAAIENDLWFGWTAPAAGFTGYVSVSTCGLTLDNTKLAAYAGTGCPVAGSALACRDDTCGTGQTTIVFPVSVAATYTIQVGNKPGFPGGAGSFDIKYVTPPSNDSCTSPQILTLATGSNVIPFDNTDATTGLEGQDAATWGCPDGGYGNFSDVWFEFTATGTGTADISTCGATGDTKLTVWTGAGCPAATWLDCNNDAAACSPQSEILGLPVTGGTTYTIQLGSVQRFQLGSSLQGGGHIMAPSNLIIVANFSALPTTTFCEPGVSGVIACPCTNPPGALGRGCNNKDATGGASLTATGTPSLSAPLATTLVFTDTGQNNIGSQLSILMQGKVLTTGIPFGHGVRCFGAFLRLYNHSGAPWIGPPGTFTAPIAPDLTIPVRCAAAGQPIPIGAQRYYQVYYRDNVNMLPAITCSTASSKQNISNGQWCTWGP